MNVNVHVFICDVIVYIACHLPLTHLLGIIVQLNKFYSFLFYSILFYSILFYIVRKSENAYPKEGAY